MNKILIGSSELGEHKWTAAMIRLMCFKREGYLTKVIRTRTSAKCYVLIRDNAEAVIFKLTRL